MNNEAVTIKCTILRGGTSKGIFIMGNELPQDMALRKKIILAVFGSPDIRQIDGLGGADLLTSKLAIIDPPSIPGADVDYSFAQVGLDDSRVEFDAICGNISSGVGPFAINNGLVKAVEPYTTVRIHMTGIGKIMIATVPVKDGKAVVGGDFSIDGVPGTGAKIALDWKNIVGGKTGKLLPTGNPIDLLEYEGKNYHASIVDAGSLSVFLQAEEMGMTGVEMPQEIERNLQWMQLIEALRGKGAVKAGLITDWTTASTTSAYLPFVCVISKARNYTCFNGRHVKEYDIDLTARLYTMGKINKTYAGSGAVCTGAAARIKESLVWNLLKESAKTDKGLLMIGHSSGMIPVEAEITGERAEVRMTKINIFRTARTIMEGQVYVQKERLQ